MNDDIFLEKYDVTKKYTIKQFDCGNAVINRSLENLKKQVMDHYIQAYILVTSENRIIGFYTLCNFAIAKSNFEQALQRSPLNVPCLRLIMLGIDQRYQGLTLGSRLLKHALKITYEVSKNTGTKGLYLDAVEGKHDFYKHLGFQAISGVKEHNELPMFLTIEAIEDALKVT